MKTVRPRAHEIPEILLSIANNLEQRQVVKCARVCRSWNESLKPLIWESVIISLWRPAHDRLIAHSRHVINLEITPPISLEQFIRFPNVHTMKIHCQFGFSKLSQSDIVQFIALNPSVVYLSLSFGFRENEDIQLWKAVSSLPLLKRLQALAFCLVDDEMNAFWEVFSKLEDADLTNIRFPGDGIQLAEWSFPRIRKLSITPARIEILEIIYRCMNLQELRWETGSDYTTLSSFAYGIKQGLVPKLERLTIYCNSRRPVIDEYLEPTIGGMQQIKSLSLDRTRFGFLSFQSLRRHFSTLADLELCFESSVTSDMNQELLCSCPLLEKFRSKYILAKDVADGGEWVCLSLKVLRLTFLFDKSEQHLQPLIFKRLSSLVLIEFFDISDFWRYSRHSGGANCALDMRLASGLDQLSGWKKIEHITFSGSEQSMEEVDIRWVISNWRRLVSFIGWFNKDTDIRQNLENLLVERGIE